MELDKKYFDDKFKNFVTKDYFDKKIKNLVTKDEWNKQGRLISAKFDEITRQAENMATKEELKNMQKLMEARFEEMTGRLEDLVTKEDLNQRADELKGIMLLKGDLLEIQKQIGRLDRRTDEDVKALAKDVRLLKQQSGMVLRDAPRVKK